MSLYIYILYSETANKYYTGFSKDPWKRLMEHNCNQDATYTSKYRPRFAKRYLKQKMMRLKLNAF